MSLVPWKPQPVLDLLPCFTIFPIYRCSRFYEINAGKFKFANLIFLVVSNFYLNTLYHRALNFSYTRATNNLLNLVVFGASLYQYTATNLSLPTHYRSFSLSRNKKINWKPSSGKTQEMKCYKRLIYKQFVKVSGLCGPQFLSYLPTGFTQLCRTLYGDAILVYRFGEPIWPPEIHKNIWNSIFL